MGLLLLVLSLLFGAAFTAGSSDEETATVTTAEAAPLTLVAHVASGQTVELRDRPGGRVVARVASETEFGSPTTLSIENAGGEWFAAHAPELENNRFAWFEEDSDAITIEHVDRRIEVDLSRRELVVHDGLRIVRRVEVGIGRAASSTPVGRFAVTDKLDGPDHGDYYGCCILALSGRQPNLPPGWIGGDRLAIHGTPNEAAIGTEASAGCVYAAEADLRWLMRTTALGTPVVIHP